MAPETQTDISRTEDPLILALLITVAQEVCTAICASEVVISSLDSKGFCYLAGTGEAPDSTARLPHGSPFGDRLKKGEVVLLKGPDGDLGTPLSTLDTSPVLAIAIPILAKGSLVGALEIFFATPSVICAADIAPLEKVADFLAPILARSACAQPMTDGSSLGSIQTQTSLPAEIHGSGQHSGRQNNKEELLDPLSVAIAPSSQASSPASQIDRAAAEKSWQAVLVPHEAATPREAPSLPAHAAVSENTTAADQASTRNTIRTLLIAVAASFLVLAVGGGWYLRKTSSPARSKLTAPVNHSPASAGVSQSPPQDAIFGHAPILGHVTLASPTLSMAHTNSQSAAASTQPIPMSTVLPEYPLIAKNQHLEGDVRVNAVIDVTGSVTSATPVSGRRLCNRRRWDALRQWKYRPATLHGKPVPMHLSVTIRFRAR